MKVNEAEYFSNNEEEKGNSRVSMKVQDETKNIFDDESIIRVVTENKNEKKDTHETYNAKNPQLCDKSHDSSIGNDLTKDVNIHKMEKHGANFQSGAYATELTKKISSAPENQISERNSGVICSSETKDSAGGFNLDRPVPDVNPKLTGNSKRINIPKSSTKSFHDEPPRLPSLNFYRRNPIASDLFFVEPVLTDEHDDASHASFIDEDKKQWTSIQESSTENQDSSPNLEKNCKETDIYSVDKSAISEPVEVVERSFRNQKDLMNENEMGIFAHCEGDGCLVVKSSITPFDFDLNETKIESFLKDGIEIRPTDIFFTLGELHSLEQEFLSDYINSAPCLEVKPFQNIKSIIELEENDDFVNSMINTYEKGTSDTLPKGGFESALATWNGNGSRSFDTYGDNQIDEAALKSLNSSARNFFRDIEDLSGNKYHNKNFCTDDEKYTHNDAISLTHHDALKTTSKECLPVTVDSESHVTSETLSKGAFGPVLATQNGNRSRSLNTSGDNQIDKLALKSLNSSGKIIFNERGRKDLMGNKYHNKNFCTENKRFTQNDVISLTHYNTFKTTSKECLPVTVDSKNSHISDVIVNLNDQSSKGVHNEIYEKELLGTSFDSRLEVETNHFNDELNSSKLKQKQMDQMLNKSSSEDKYFEFNYVKQTITNKNSFFEEVEDILKSFFVIDSNFGEPQCYEHRRNITQTTSKKKM